MDRNVKAQVLLNLKQAWKREVAKQFEKEPDKVRNANIDKNAEEIASNPVIKASGFTKEDIVKVLREIRDEVCGSVTVKYCCAYCKSQMGGDCLKGKAHCYYAIGGKPKEQCKIENNVCVGSLAEGHKECWEAR